MIAADDMRPEMSAYGNDYMQTPNFKALANDGFVFRRCRLFTFWHCRLETLLRRS
jgi:hypothetical protein